MKFDLYQWVRKKGPELTEDQWRRIEHYVRTGQEVTSFPPTWCRALIEWRDLH